jgi:hypothetical protein
VVAHRPEPVGLEEVVEISSDVMLVLPATAVPTFKRLPPSWMPFGQIFRT